MRHRTILILLGLVSLFSPNAGCKKKSSVPDDTAPAAPQPAVPQAAITPPLGTVQEVPQAKAENGWPLYELPNEGIAIALPPDWRRVDMDPANIDSTFKEILKA